MTTKLYTSTGRLYLLHWEMRPGSTGTPPIAAVELAPRGYLEPLRCIWAGQELELASLDVLADFIGGRIRLFESKDSETVSASN